MRSKLMDPVAHARLRSTFRYLRSRAIFAHLTCIFGAGVMVGAIEILWRIQI